MTERKGLSLEERDALIKYRLEKADTTIDDAEKALQYGISPRTIKNCLYYGCYYALRALMCKTGLTSKTHEGVKGMFGLHFVKTGKIGIEYGRAYSDFMNARLTGDYDDFDMEIELNQEDVDLARRFVAEIKRLISSED
ncbi:MAG: HEPN domain-containing protein [Bacteroidales bacterium]|nr:HEPN domain-containing protein [Bacteroidales bacterium]MCD8393478.1 HEPN domain-containing protein [Bacteroidales bacterium]